MKNKVQRFKKSILILSILMTGHACSTSKLQTKNETKKEAYYNLQRFKQNQPNDSAIVVVKGESIKGESFDSFILKVIKSDAYEVYKFTNETEGVVSLGSETYEFEFLELSSSRLKTHEIRLNERDSVRIKFYLEPAKIEGYRIETGRKNRK